MKKERFYLIDLFKIISSICIVMIHTIATGGRVGTFYTFLGKIIYGFPVPFFFVCSGFLLGEKVLKKKDDNKKIFLDYIKRLLIPLCFWCFISMFFVFDFKSNFLNLSFWLEIIWRFIVSPWCAMWYVMGLIIAIIIIYPFLKKEKWKWLFTLSIILFFIGLLGGNYYFIIENTTLAKPLLWYYKIFLTMCNGIFYGLPFVSCGFFIAYYKQKKTINYSYVFPFTIISFITLIIEVYLLENKSFLEISTLYISSIIFIPSTVLYLTKFKANKPNFSLLCKYSVGIYFMHQFINYVYKYFTDLVGIKLFLVVFATTLILLTILYKINNKYINKVIT